MNRSVHKSLLRISLAAALVACTLSAHAQGLALTNADVTRLAAAEVSDRTVIAAINEAKATQFDLGAVAVRALAAAGVSVSVIDAMRQRSLSTATPATSRAAPKAAPPSLAEAAGAATAQRATSEKSRTTLTNANFAEPPLPELPPDPAGEGRWKISLDRNPLNDRPIVTAMLAAEGPIKGWLDTSIPTLVVRCQTPLDPNTFPAVLPIQPGLEVYVVTGMPATVENGEGIHDIQVRFDGQPATTTGSSESTNRKALFMSSIFATEMVVTKRTLATSKQMLVGFTPFNASPVLITFDVRGFRTHLNRILSACPSWNR